MLPRAIGDEFKTLLNEYPVVTLLGPRQSGKTTFARHALPNHAYCNLELPDVRAWASSDPRSFLAQFKDKVILDEIQRVPELLSYVQAIVDERKINGQFVLTGSHQLRVREAVSQSLAGRTAILHLLPFSIDELSNAKIAFDRFEEYAFHGFLPGIYDRNIRPATAYSNYYQTYVERDVRQLVNLKDASLFEKTMKLLAGRSGQLLDFSSLANDVGVDAKTIRNWISILESSFILFKLPPYFENFGKRLVKSPKYYFTEVGLLCFLLGIRNPDQIARDPLVGSIFENLVVVEILKARYNIGMMPDLYFFRDSTGNEVDLLLGAGRSLIGAEIKSASTFSIKQMKGLKRLRAITDRLAESYLIYNGERRTMSDETTALHFKDCARLVRRDAVHSPLSK
jgi:uncharacterized protein